MPYIVTIRNADGTSRCSCCSTLLCGRDRQAVASASAVADILAALPIGAILDARPIPWSALRNDCITTHYVPAHDHAAILAAWNEKAAA